MQRNADVVEYGMNEALGLDEFDISFNNHTIYLKHIHGNVTKWKHNCTLTLTPSYSQSYLIYKIEVTCTAAEIH